MADGSPDRLVCRCYVVRESVIREAIGTKDLHLVEEVTACTRAGGGCSSCWDDIQDILSSIRGKPLPRNVPDASGLSGAQKRERIVKAVEADVQSLLDRNGLSMQLVEVSGDRVLVRFYGEAVGTPAASFLAIKRHLVRKMSDACGQKMNLIELNVLESQANA